LQDNGAKAMTASEIWNAVPSSMHLPHSFGHFKKSLASMLNHGYLVGSGRGSSKLIRIAPRTHFLRVKARDKGYRDKGYTATAKKKAAKTKHTKPVVKTAQNPIVAAMDVELDALSKQIKDLTAKREKLRRMRGEAASL
jgi:hypothetical protein